MRLESEDTQVYGVIDSRRGNRQCRGRGNLHHSSFPGMMGDGFKRGEQSWRP